MTSAPYLLVAAAFLAALLIVLFFTPSHLLS